jgi:hypothetical protein
LSNTLDLYHSANATSPSWQYIGSFPPGGAGVRTISATFTLAASGRQAIRGRYRYQGSPSSCTVGAYDDHDDLVFEVSLGTFTDDPLVAGSTIVKTTHFTELRIRIDALRSRFGLSGYSWTDASLDGRLISRTHVEQLRVALQEAYAAAKVSAPSFTDSSITAGAVLVKAVHITELRAAVVLLEGR